MTETHLEIPSTGGHNTPESSVNAAPHFVPDPTHTNTLVVPEGNGNGNGNGNAPTRTDSRSPSPSPSSSPSPSATPTPTPTPTPTLTPALVPEAIARTPTPTAPLASPTIITGETHLVPTKSVPSSSVSGSKSGPATSPSNAASASASPSKPSSTTDTTGTSSWWKNSSKDARYALIILFIINLLNYIDRYVPSGTKSLFQADLNLTDTQTSLPLTAFMIVYMVLAPCFSYLSDIGYPRKWLIAMGVASWSVATSTTGLANNYAIFIVSRAFIGVGEAAYATIAPVTLSDYWSSHQRNSMLSFFYLAMPLGAAIGYGIGGYVGDAAGWRVAFIVCGTPGVLMAILTLKIVEPPRGCQESIAEIVIAMEQKTVSLKEALLELPRNAYYCYVVLGSIFVTFASGGMADWIPEWLHREHDISVSSAGLVVGGVTVIGGIGGIVVGAYLGNYLRARVNNAYLLASSIGLFVACIFAILVLIMPTGVGMGILGVLILLCQIGLWIYVGPINSLIANCVPTRLRVRAFGISILVMHTLGDAISPSIIGAISDASGSLTKALILVPVTFLGGAIVWGIGWYRLQPLAFETHLKHKQAPETPTPPSDPIITSEPPAITLHSEPRKSLIHPGTSDSSHEHGIELQSIHVSTTMIGNTPVVILESEKYEEMKEKEMMKNEGILPVLPINTSVDGPDPMLGILRTQGSQIELIHDDSQLRNRHPSKEEIKTP